MKTNGKTNGKTDMTNKKVMAVVLGAVMALVGAACGGDDVDLRDGDVDPGGLPPGDVGPSGTPGVPPGTVPTIGPSLEVPEDVRGVPPVLLDRPSSGGAATPLVGSVRLRGMNAGDISFFGLEVSSVEILAGGVPLAPALTPETGLDLARTGHAFLIGGFEWPDGVGEVLVSVKLADSASFETPAGTSAVDSALPPITFTASKSQVEARGHAVIELDLQGSLVDVGGSFELLPKAIIRY